MLSLGPDVVSGFSFELEDGLHPLPCACGFAKLFGSYVSVTTLCCWVLESGVCHGCDASLWPFSESFIVEGNFDGNSEAHD